MKTITVRYFASMREKMGKSEELIDINDVCSVADIWSRLSGEPLPPHTLVALNQEYVSLNQIVKAGDEVAFFPPVTGG